VTEKLDQNFADDPAADFTQVLAPVLDLRLD
jgi:hypothetical protein